MKNKKLTKLRHRRLSNTSYEDLKIMNKKLKGKGPNWITDERRSICIELARRTSEIFEDALSCK